MHGRAAARRPRAGEGRQRAGRRGRSSGAARSPTFGDPATARPSRPTVAVGRHRRQRRARRGSQVRVDVRVVQPGEKERVEAAMARAATPVARRPTIEVARRDQPAADARVGVGDAVRRSPSPRPTGSASTVLAGVAVGGGSDGNFTAALGVPDARRPRRRRRRRPRRPRVRARSTRWSTAAACSPA